MIRAFLLSVAQLGDRAILGVLARSLAVTLALFAGLGVALWFGLDAALGGWTGAGSGALAAAAALVVAVLAGWLLFRTVAIAVIGVFADAVVEAVEARHYPSALATARPVPFGRSAATGLRSAARAVAVNAALLPLYLLLLATGIGTAALFFAANGWLLGRDLRDMVAARHLDPATMRAARAATRPHDFLLGLAATALFVVPLLNLLAPILGTAMATHRFHRGRT